MSNLILLDDLGMLYPNENSNQKRRYGLYKCFCGNEFKTQIEGVKNKRTKSCGCYGKKIKTTHGFKGHELYTVWCNMKSRCNNKNSKYYSNYGGRGIEVCERWLDIKNFIEDMYPSFEQGLSLDRMDVDGNYSKENCRWATRNIQQRNTRKICSKNTSGYRGVTFDKKTNKWKTQIVVNGKIIYLGYFIDKTDAAKAYDKYVIDNNLEHTINGVAF